MQEHGGQNTAGPRNLEHEALLFGVRLCVLEDEAALLAGRMQPRGLLCPVLAEGMPITLRDRAKIHGGATLGTVGAAGARLGAHLPGGRRLPAMVAPRQPITLPRVLTKQPI
jgi:hypothetical protein